MSVGKYNALFGSDDKDSPSGSAIQAVDTGKASKLIIAQVSGLQAGQHTRV